MAHSSATPWIGANAPDGLTSGGRGHEGPAGEAKVSPAPSQDPVERFTPSRRGCNPGGFSMREAMS